MTKFVCFGEVLWDVFDTHKKIGGAPLNVANRLKSFHNDVAIITAVGNDELAKPILKLIEDLKINLDAVSILNDYNTGEVNVTLNNKGSATYSIPQPKAWDKIPYTKASENLVKQADAFVFGSLITRDNVSKETLFKLLELSNYKIFDVNLRAPFYQKEVLIDLMHKADFIKFNDEELYEISDFLGSKFNNLEQNIHFISEKTKTKHICVTKGEHGAVLLYNDCLFYNSGYRIKVKDTVGSGDSFLASLISKLRNGATPQDSINFACAVGALVAANEGANPVITAKEINAFSLI